MADPYVVTVNNPITPTSGGWVRMSSLIKTIDVTSYPFNADPSGISDSTAAFQAALNAVPSFGSGVYAPTGTYLISNTLSIKPLTRFFGDGMGLSTLKVPDACATTSFPMLYLNGDAAVGGELPMRYVHLWGLSFDGNDINQSSGTQTGLRFRRAQYCSVIDCEVKSFKEQGVQLIWNSGEDTNTSIVFDRNLIRDCNNDHFTLDNCGNIDFLNNTIRTGSGNGIVFSGAASSRIRIVSNQFNQPAKSAVLCIGANGTSDVQIQANEIYSANSTQADRAAIHATGVNGWSVEANDFYNLLGSGIYMDNNYGRIQDNYLNKVNRNGITAVNAHDMTIGVNTVIDAGLEANDTYDSFFLTVTNSTITTNTARDRGGVNRPRYGMNLSGGAGGSYIAINSLVGSGVSGNLNAGDPSCRLFGNDV